MVRHLAHGASVVAGRVGGHPGWLRLRSGAPESRSSGPQQCWVLERDSGVGWVQCPGESGPTDDETCSSVGSGGGGCGVVHEGRGQTTPQPPNLGSGKDTSSGIAAAKATADGAGVRVNFCVPAATAGAGASSVSPGQPVAGVTDRELLTARHAGDTASMVRRLFLIADADRDGYICSSEYRSMLQSIGVWEQCASYTDARWSLTWAQICQHLGAVCVRGVDEPALCRRYTSCPGLLPHHLAQAAAAATISTSLQLGSSGAMHGAWGGCTIAFTVPKSPRPGRGNGWLVEHAGVPHANGIYLPAELPRYTGVQPYLRAAGSGGGGAPADGWTIWLLRWAQRRWTITDVGVTVADRGVEFSFEEEQRRLYVADCRGVAELGIAPRALPPAGGWEHGPAALLLAEERRRQRRGGPDQPTAGVATQLNDDGSRRRRGGGGSDGDDDAKLLLLPGLRELSACDRGWSCRLCGCGPIADKIAQLEGLEREVQGLGGQKHELLRGTLVALRAASSLAVVAATSPRASGVSVHAARLTVRPADGGGGGGGDFWGSWCARPAAGSGGLSDSSELSMSEGFFNGFSVGPVFGSQIEAATSTTPGAASEYQYPRESIHGHTTKEHEGGRHDVAMLGSTCGEQLRGTLRQCRARSPSTHAVS